MPKKINIKCLNNNQNYCLPKGLSLKEIAEEIDIKTEHPVIGALVNNKIAELSFEVYRPKSINFIDITHHDGMRMYIRGLCFVLYKAVQDLFPEGKLFIKHSVSNGIYCEIENNGTELQIQDVFNIGQRMREIVEGDYKFKRKELALDEALAQYEEHGLGDKIDVLSSRGQAYTSFYQMDGAINNFYGYMPPSTSYLKVFDLNKYYNGMLLQVPKKSNPLEVEDLIIQNKMYEIFQEHSSWNKILEVPSIGALNSAEQKGSSETIIKVSEALHEKKIAQIADRIANHKNDIKIILISGPSSSGKTTFGKRLAIQLMVSGMKPLNLSLDNYFVDREETPLDEFGHFDFEALNALDIELFNQNLLDLLNGEEIQLPKFSFEQGKQYLSDEKMQMTDENVLIIEGIHGLNPQLTHSIPGNVKFKVYVSALTSLNIDNHNRVHTTDNRLIRRIVRDYRYRKYSAQDTISRWPSVRRGEEKHIFPFQEEADVMFNSALLYELSVLKPFAEPILLEVQPNQPEYSEATRLLKFFSYFKPIEPVEIPPTSIIREFFGGSSFSY